MRHRTISTVAGVATVTLLAVAVAPPSNAVTVRHPVKTITVATEGTYAPFTFHDASNKLTGYDVEVFNAVAKKAGYKVKWQETTWDGIFAGLDAKRWDAIANEVTIRPDRIAKYDITLPYTISNYAIVTRAADTRVKTATDIKGLTTAQSATSSFADLAKQYGADVQTVEGFTQAIALLQLGRVDATLNDSLAVLDYLRNNRDAGVKIAAQFGDASRQGFVFRKGSGYMPAFNKALRALITNGTIAKLGVKYFGRDVSK